LKEEFDQVPISKGTRETHYRSRSSDALAASAISFPESVSVSPAAEASTVVSQVAKYRSPSRAAFKQLIGCGEVGDQVECRDLLAHSDVITTVYRTPVRSREEIQKLLRGFQAPPRTQVAEAKRRGKDGGH
jgi:hypothetical protein